MMTLTFAIESVEDGRFAVSFAKYIKSILLKNQECPNLLDQTRKNLETHGMGVEEAAYLQMKIYSV